VMVCIQTLIVFMCMLMLYFVPTDLDIFGEPTAGSIVRKWRAQKQLDDERSALQDRVMNAEHHFRAMCTTGEVTDQNAEAFEAFWRHIKNARTELVSFCTF
jgi:hypothetical protein